VDKTSRGTLDLVRPKYIRWSIMNEEKKIDLTLNRSLEEMVASYWEAIDGDIGPNQYGSFYDLENYLNKLGALESRYKLLGDQHNKIIYR
jgi:hypothetical protein